MAERNASYWINKLQLKKHPEGGYFKEIYRSDEIIPESALPYRYSNSRNHSTSIYFLLNDDEFSAFHRLASDELWHFYDGSPLMIHIIHPDGKPEEKKLGLNIENGENPLAVIPRNTWFAAEVIDKNAYTLIGCTVSPAFDFDDFELAEKAKLLKDYPQHATLIERLCSK